MEILYIIIPAIIVFLIVTKFFAKGINSITTTEAKELLQNNKNDYFFMDVRTAREFKANKIKGFKNIPLDQINNRLDQIPKDKKLVVMCQSGSRSTVAARQLVKAGYTEISNVRGGISLWR